MTQTGYSTKTHHQIQLGDECHDLFYVFEDFYVLGMQDVEINGTTGAWMSSINTRRILLIMFVDSLPERKCFI